MSCLLHKEHWVSVLVLGRRSVPSDAQVRQVSKSIIEQRLESLDLEKQSL